VNDDGFGVLHAAAETGRADLIPWLVERGAALETRTRHGNTALARGHRGQGERYSSKRS